jgi:hypothetical protein
MFHYYVHQYYPRSRFHRYGNMGYLPFVLDLCLVFFIHSSAFTHLSRFHSLVIVSTGTINIVMQVYVLGIDLPSFRYVIKCGPWCGLKICLFLVFGGTHTDFYRNCSSLYPPPKLYEVFLSLSSFMHFLLVFLMFAILIEVRLNLCEVWLYVWLMTMNVVQFFMYLICVCISSSDNCLLILLFHLLVELFVLIQFSFWAPCIFQKSILHPSIWWWRFFSHSVLLLLDSGNHFYWCSEAF